HRFKTLTKANSSVLTASGEKCKVEGVGEAVIQTSGGQLNLKNVKLTPEFDANLISVSKLTDDGYWVLFKQHSATLLLDGKEVLTVPRKGGLYQLDEVPEVAMKAGTKDWHAALGHPCEKKLKELKKKFPQLHMSHPD